MSAGDLCFEETLVSLPIPQYLSWTAQYLVRWHIHHVFFLLEFSVSVAISSSGTGYDLHLWLEFSLWTCAGTGTWARGPGAASPCAGCPLSTANALFAVLKRALGFNFLTILNSWLLWLTGAGVGVGRRGRMQEPCVLFMHLSGTLSESVWMLP